MGREGMEWGCSPLFYFVLLKLSKSLQIGFRNTAQYCFYFICRDHIFSIKVSPFVLTNSRLQISLKDFSLFCPSLQFSEALCQNLDFLYKHLEFLHINDPHFQYPSADRLVIINIAVF